MIVTGYPEIAGYMIYFVLALISVFTLYMFYLIWLYIKSTSLIISGSKEEFDDDFEV